MTAPARVRRAGPQAFSKNQAGLSKYAASLFSGDPTEALTLAGSKFASLEAPLRSIAVWSKLNFELAAWAEREQAAGRMPYHRVRIEDLALDGSARHIALGAVAALTNFTGGGATRACDLCALLRKLHEHSLGSHDRAAAASNAVVFGKWRHLADRATQKSLSDEARRALAQFGYPTDPFAAGPGVALAPAPPPLSAAATSEILNGCEECAGELPSSHHAAARRRASLRRRGRRRARRSARRRP